MTAYSKAIVAFVVGALMLALNQMGITEDTSVMEAITVLVTTGAVYIFPNRG